MVIRIGSNILSQTIQRNLSRSSADLATASERLSSGQRINRGSDDAAGLSIAMSLDKDNVITRTAQRNVSDGISMLSIVGSGLRSQKEILFRMAELAEQSANGSYSSTQRRSLQREYVALMDEFDRIADTTEFNGVKLLRDSSGASIQLMAGISGADTSLLSVTTANSHRFAGTLTQKSDYNESGGITASDSSNFFQMASNLSSSYFTGIGADRLLQTPELHDAGEYRFTDSGGNSGSLFVFMMRSFGDAGFPFNISKYSTTLPDSTSETPLRQDLIYVARLDQGATSTGTSLQLTNGANPSVPSAQVTVSFASTGTIGTINLDFSSLGFELYDKAKPSYTPTAIGFTNLYTAANARRGLVTVNNRIDLVSNIEGQYGALESRLRVAHSVLGASGENLAAASSRIKDADVAAESANVVRTQILQQTGAALLGQANLAPQIGLQLLQNA